MAVAEKVGGSFDADFIVVGAGSAGAALAARLSECGKYRVMLLEAGGEAHMLARVPISYALFVRDPKANWLYSSEPEERTGGRRIPVPRGRMLGGSSSINGLAWVRGNHLDYDHWAQMGCRGWSFEEVLPFFKKMESFEGGGDELRGADGPVRVSTIPQNLELYSSFFDACKTVGIERTADYNGRTQIGSGMTQASMSRGRRMSTAETYLKPARKRKNLIIETNAHAQKLLVRDGRCIGVRFLRGGQAREAFAAREVIVSSGAIASPQLLEVSGIGQAERLRGLGSDVVLDLPGVGENLRDHWAPRMKWTVARRGQTFNERARGLGALRQGLSYFFDGSGFLSMPAATFRAFFKTDDRFEMPDSMFVLQPFLITPDSRLSPVAGITIVTHQLRPESTGSVHVNSTDVGVKPSIRFNFLSEQTDRDCLLSSMKLVRKVVAAPSLAWLQPREMLPGPAAVSDSELLDFVANNAETGFHPVGTCKMGPGRDAVVDEKLRVRGIDGLRVADASIMPTMISGNTNAPSIMIGEKAAQMVLEAWR